MRGERSAGAGGRRPWAAAAATDLASRGGGASPARCAHRGGPPDAALPLLARRRRGGDRAELPCGRGRSPVVSRRGSGPQGRRERADPPHPASLYVKVFRSARPESLRDLVNAGCALLRASALPSGASWREGQIRDPQRARPSSAPWAQDRGAVRRFAVGEGLPAT